MSTRPLSTPFVIEFLPIDSLLPDPANPRWMAEAGMEALERSIREYGVVEPILARRTKRIIISGHQRWTAARRAGLTIVPVILLDLPEDRARILGLAMNKIGGVFDAPLLAQLLGRLKDRPDVDLSLTGFSEREITGVLRSLQTREKRDRPETFDLEAALAAAGRVPRVRLDDIWVLGPHRVMCGDATKTGDVERLLEGGHAAMAFIDPPYNVALGDHGGQGRDQPQRRMANDDLEGEAWEWFVRAWVTNLLPVVYGALYVCMSSKELPLVSRVLAELGGHWSDTIIYAKDRFVLGRADYQRAYEPIWYGWREGIQRYWSGDRDQGDVWNIARPSTSPLHPVMKPLALMERAIRNSSRDLDVVLDLFLGSGSTLIACERTGRTCAGLELDPLYLEVAIARWEAFTGETATLADVPPDESKE